MQKAEEKATQVEATEQQKGKAVSKTYTLKQFGEIIEKLDLLKWITKEERSTLEKLREQAKNKFIAEL